MTKTSSTGWLLGCMARSRWRAATAASKLWGFAYQWARTFSA